MRRLLPVACSVGSILLLLLVAAVPESPFHPLLPVGEQAVAPLRAIADLIGLDALSRDGLAAVAIVVLLTACAAFVWSSRVAWRGALSVRTVFWWAVVFNLAMLTVPLLMSRDVYSYAMYGKISGLYHQNPYVSVPADFPDDPLLALTGPKWNDTPAVYGPMFSMLSAQVTSVVSDIGDQIFFFRLLAVIASIATLMVIRRFVGQVAPTRTAFVLVLFGWNPVVLFHSVASGHNDILVALAVIGALWLVSRKHDVLAAVVLALGMSVKVTAALPLLLLVVAVYVRRSSGERLIASAKVVAAAAGTWLLFALPFLQTSDPTLGMANLAGHEGWLAPSRLFRKTIENALRDVGLDTVATLAAGLIRVAFPAVLLYSLYLIVRRMTAAGSSLTFQEQGAAWGWALLVLMLTGPVLLPWYIVWVLPLAFLFTDVPRRAVVALSVLLAMSEVVAEPLRSPKIWEGMLIGVHYVITVGVFAVLVWLVRELRRRVGEGRGLDLPVGEPGREPGREVASEAYGQA
ncbi:MAG: glycosyltransferase 87 family protein [Actinobacteria bacterium]|nr:glycosyltransferase 87 family protein [Actinomycetota bacterium]